MTSKLIEENNIMGEYENEQMKIEIKNRGIFTNTQLFQFVVDNQGNKITLGEGSFGFVMLIRNIKTNHLYALKLIPMSSIETLTHKKIIEREVRIHPELSHPYIIKMYDAFINKEAIYIILEYAVNKTVQETFLQKFTYNEERAFKYFYQTCLAIDYLHRKGIMHRDIKPENLLLDEDDNIKMCDFGWCAEITKQRRTTLCGTFEYMAPETIMQKEYDYKIDIWQLGILLYELLHGRTPFKPDIDLEEDDLMDYFKNLINQGHVIFDSHISPAAIDLMSQILIYVPEKRISLQGIFAHIWIFQMKAKTNYKENEEIIHQFEQAEKNIVAVKLNQEKQLLQTQKLMQGYMSQNNNNNNNNKFNIPNRQQQSLVSEQNNLFNSNNIFKNNNNSNLITNENTSPNEERTSQAIKLPDWSANMNPNASIEQKNQMKKNNQNENKEMNIQGGGSQIKQNTQQQNQNQQQIDKSIYDKNPIYERELQRMLQDNINHTITLDLHDLLFKQEQKIIDQKQQQFYLPSYVQRRDYQQQINVRQNTGKQSVFKLSTQFDINLPSSNRRAIFGDFEKDKKLRNIQELEKLVEQIDFDKNNSNSRVVAAGNNHSNKNNAENNNKAKSFQNIPNYDNLSEMSQVSSVKNNVFQTKQF